MYLHSVETRQSLDELLNQILIRNTADPEPWSSILFPELTSDSLIPHNSNEIHFIELLLIKEPDTNNTLLHRG